MDKPYQSYNLEELATDPDFRDWVLNPTPENSVFWQNFVNNNPEKVILIQEAETLVRGVHIYFGKETTDPQMLSRHFEEVRLRVDQQSSPAQSGTIIRSFPYRRLIAAASIVLVMGISGWIWINQLNSQLIYATGFGEWETVSLPDGSTVKLNANSELKLAKNWEEGSDRTVWLKGEAFFEVEKKPATGDRFYVIANQLSVEVLGTSFNVISRGGKTEVFLEEGKLKLEMGKEEALMSPGDFIAYSASSQQIIEKRKNINDLHSSWKDGVLILQETSVREILGKIEEIYGVEFEVEDTALLESNTTVRIPMDKFEIALPILEKTLGTRFIQIGTRLIVK